MTIHEDSESKNGFHFLYPSTLFVSQVPFNIHTLLGSCIAVCLFDPLLKCGGMNHYMVPFWNGEGLESPRYGNIAIEMLAGKMAHLGSQNRNMIAKVFGGGSVIGETTINIGERNIQVAETVLKKLNVRIVATSVGGDQGRKIVFNTSTGEVLMKYISKNNSLQSSK